MVHQVGVQLQYYTINMKAKQIARGITNLEYYNVLRAELLGTEDFLPCTLNFFIYKEWEKLMLLYYTSIITSS